LQMNLVEKNNNVGLRPSKFFVRFTTYEIIVWRLGLQSVSQVWNCSRHSSTYVYASYRARHEETSLPFRLLCQYKLDVRAFRLYREVDEICAVMGYYTDDSGNSKNWILDPST